jgi:hypothetical protein
VYVFAALLACLQLHHYCVLILQIILTFLADPAIKAFVNDKQRAVIKQMASASQQICSLIINNSLTADDGGSPVCQHHSDAVGCHRILPRIR